MNKSEMIIYVDMVCENQGYTDSPSYDLIYEHCCKGRNDDESKEMIYEILSIYN